MLITILVTGFVIGIVFVTFFHPTTSTSGIIQLKYRKEIEQLVDLKAISGNIASLQSDSSRNQTWIMAGSWKLKMPRGNQSSPNFYAEMTMTEIGGNSSYKLVLSDFQLLNQQINETSAVFNGSAMMSSVGDEGPPSFFNQTYAVSITFKILSLKTIGIFVSKNDISDHFGETPIFGTVSFKKSSVK